MSVVFVVRWARIMLIVVGMCELLMASGAAGGVRAVGLVGGLVVVGAALILPSRRAVGAAMLAVGTVPFAVVAWSAIVPVVVLIVAAGLATTIYRSDAHLV